MSSEIKKIKKGKKKADPIEVKPLNIIIAGSTNTGKSTVANIIKNALESNGLIVNLIDNDDVPGLSTPYMKVSDMERNIKAIRGKKLSIKVQTLQLGRMGMKALNTSPTLNESAPIVRAGSKIFIDPKKAGSVTETPVEGPVEDAIDY